jgi:hypothetical protein
MAKYAMPVSLFLRNKEAAAVKIKASRKKSPKVVPALAPNLATK